MTAKDKIISYIKNPFLIIPFLGYRGIFHWIPDALWLKIVFRIKVRRIILIYSFDFKERINRCNNLCYNIIWSL